MLQQVGITNGNMRHSNRTIRNDRSIPYGARVRCGNNRVRCPISIYNNRTLTIGPAQGLVSSDNKRYLHPLGNRELATVHPTMSDTVHNMKIFLIADTHFSTEGPCKWVDGTGRKIRPFDNAKEMDEYMIEKWNSVVMPEDKVYHLGDVAFRNNTITIMNKLNGKKVLIKGNHDQLKPRKYLEFFKDIRGSHMIDKYIFTHIPIHPSQKYRFEGNIHGHTHSNVVRYTTAEAPLDPWYFCVSVEQIGYTPIEFEAVKAQYDKR